MLTVAMPAKGAEEADVLSNSIGMKLVHVPAGSFVMGSPRSEHERDAREYEHEVSITKPFLMGMFEVTQQQYAKVMSGSDFQNRAAFNEDRGGGPDHPMENVEWKNANMFCERLSQLPDEVRHGRTYRLPTEAEWEFACRAGTSTAFHYGDALSSSQANFNGNYPQGSGTGPYLRQTAKVGSYPPNALGLYDMHGNVAEWCADWFDPNYYDDSPQEDPLGPPFGVVATSFSNSNDNFFVVVRGGCWVDDARACRSAYRYRAMPNTQYRLIGFRVVCETESNVEGQ